ncbi:MAG: precorrin-2 dehydrogenase/sirohydrochlorin ferrochelatase family protein [Candidatus Anammoxibacter sp.]
MPKYYPIYLNINARKCVVIGGGEVAYRKACGLQEAGGEVVVVSPEFCRQLSEKDVFTLKKKLYEESDIDGAAIVVASTNDEDVNKRVYNDATKRNVPVNVVDQPHFCSFIVPSIIRRGDLCVSISTGGTGPALAKNIRIELEEQFGYEYADFTQLLSSMRQVVLSTITDENKRKTILVRFAGKEFLEMIKNDGKDAAEKAMREIIAAAGGD